MARYWVGDAVEPGDPSGDPASVHPGPPPTCAADRERITEATVRLLDAEGLAKFSMRRLAAELNVTAMSVYWYVDTKDDLLELALDAVFGGRQVDPEQRPSVGCGIKWKTPSTTQTPQSLGSERFHWIDARGTDRGHQAGH